MVYSACSFTSDCGPLSTEVQIPGLTTPLSHLPLLVFSLLISQIVHEAGHFFSAAMYVFPLYLQVNFHRSSTSKFTDVHAILATPSLSHLLASPSQSSYPQPLLLFPRLPSYPSNLAHVHVSQLQEHGITSFSGACWSWQGGCGIRCGYGRM